MSTFVERRLVDTLSFAEVVFVISAFKEAYLLFGIRSLFLRSNYHQKYIENAVNSGSYTKGFVRDGSDHSILFPESADGLPFL